MNRREMKRAPVLRFKGFTNDWEQRKLKDCLEINSGRDYKHLHSGNIPVFGTGGYMLSVDEALSYKNAIGIGRKGTIDKPQLLIAPFWTVDTLFFLTPENDTDLYFLFSFFQKVNWKKYDESTGLPSLSKKTISTIKIKTPSKNEQIKIGTLIQKVNNLISLQQRKLDILIKLNRNIIINLFKEIRVNHHAIELKHTASNWKSARLKELGICQSGFGFPIKEQNGSKGIPFFKVSDFNTFGNEIYLQYANNYVTNHQIRKNKWKIFDQVPAIVFAKVGAAIFLNRKRMINEPFLIDNNLMAFELNRQKLDYKFAKILFDNMYLPKFAQVGALPSYNASDINAIKVKIPDMDSQKKIANIIMKNNNEIILQKQILQKGKELKQFLLQNMFI